MNLAGQPVSPVYPVLVCANAGQAGRLSYNYNAGAWNFVQNGFAMTNRNREWA